MNILRLITEGYALVGLATIRDVLVYIGRHGAGALEAKIAAVMTRDVMSVTPETPLDEVREDAAHLFDYISGVYH